MPKALRIIAALLAGLLPGTSWAGVCDLPSLNAALDEAEAAWGAADLDRFVGRRGDARLELGCLNELISPQSAAAYHQMEALSSYLPPRDLEGAVLSFLAARESWAGYALSPELVPEGNLLRAQWELSAGRASQRAPLSPPGGYTLYVDGDRTDSRPSDRPGVLQLMDPAGDVAWTRYLRPEDPDPTWGDLALVAAAPPELEPEVRPVVPLPVEPLPEPRSRLTLPLALSSGGAALLSGGLWTAALVKRADLYEERGSPGSDPLPSSEEAAVEAERRGVNALGYAAQASGALALTLGAGAALSLRW